MSKTQSELILEILGSSVDQIVEVHNRAKEQEQEVLGFAFPLPSIKILNLPVVFSNNVKQVEALISTKQGARSDEVQVTTISPPTPRNRNEQDTPEHGTAMGDGDRQDGRDDQHTPPPIPKSVESEAYPNTKPASHAL